MTRRPHPPLPLFLVVLLAVMSGCAGGPPPATDATRPDENPWNLTVFHINDMHCAFLPEPAHWRDDRALTGGVAALAAHLEEQRATAPAALFFDAGDFMTGNPFCEMEDDGVRGAAWMDMINLLGLDAGVLGNHEFDLGRENTRRLAARADYPLMALDLRDVAGALEYPTDPVVLERGGLRVGVIGVTCRTLFEYASADLARQLRLADQVETARRWAAELDPGTDLLVLITHNGIDGDLALARDLAGSGVDLIVGGHSHTRLNDPEVVGDILVVQAGSKLKNLGRLDLRVEDDRIAAYDGRLIPLLVGDRRAPPEIEAAVAAAAARVDAEYGRVIGELAGTWRRDGRAECDVGNWICDVLRTAAGADVALLNTGTLRTNLEPGPVTLLDVMSLLPFDNQLETFEIDGRTLARIARVNAQAAVDREHGIMQVSGLRYVYAVEAGAARIVEAAVDGQPIAPDRVYTVACPDFLVTQAETYMDMAPPVTTPAGGTITGIVIDAIEQAGTIGEAPGGRIVRE